MSDVRTEVAQAIWLRHTHASRRGIGDVEYAWKLQKEERTERIDDFLLMADQAIAAATPHIRAALFDELEEYISSRQGQDPIIAVMLARKYVRTLKDNTQP